MTISEVLHNELNALRAENAALKEQAECSEEINSNLQGRLNILLVKHAALQSKSAALVDALNDCEAWLNRNGYFMQAHEVEAALAAFKGEK